MDGRSFERRPSASIPHMAEKQGEEVRGRQLCMQHVRNSARKVF